MASKQRSEKILVEVTSRGTITLPKALRSAHLYEVRPAADGVLELVPQHTVAASQAWFWSDRWQRMEREADADIANGRVTRVDSADALIEELGQL